MIESTRPCPFCGGRNWIPWYIHKGKKKAQLVKGDTIALIDMKYMKEGYKYYTLWPFDECVECGAVIS